MDSLCYFYGLTTVGGATQAVKPLVSPPNATFLTFRELNKKLIPPWIGTWKRGFASPLDRQLLKNARKIKRPIILTANKSILTSSLRWLKLIF